MKTIINWILKNFKLTKFEIEKYVPESDIYETTETKGDLRWVVNDLIKEYGIATYFVRVKGQNFGHVISMTKDRDAIYAMINDGGPLTRMVLIKELTRREAVAIAWNDSQRYDKEGRCTQ